MKYSDGRPVSLGDRVRLWKNQLGTVVCSIDTGEFSPEYPKEQWAYLKFGVMIRTDAGDLFHYSHPDEDFELIRSGGRS